jgi:tetratricopeptide (TPR) repeat protein
MAGTDQQTKIMSDYPSQTPKDKLRIPYIERQNGNLCIKSLRVDDSDQQMKDTYRVAITYYNKALLALKMLFESDYQESQVIMSMADSTDLIKNVEVPVCLNLGLCYLKREEYHHAIKYCTQVIDKKIPAKFMAPGTLEKAFYRRGMSYLKIGDLKKAKEDFLKANELADGKNGQVIQGLKTLKAKLEENRVKERELSQKMIMRKEEKSKPSEELILPIKGAEIFSNAILALLFDIFFLVYSIMYKKIIELADPYINESVRGYLEHPMAQQVTSRLEPEGVKRWVKDIVDKRAATDTVKPEAEKKNQ